MAVVTRSLGRYLGAATGARLADEGARVAIVLLVLGRTGNAAVGGLLVAALMVPHVVAAPLVGAAADTVRHRKPLYFTAFFGYATSLALSAILIGSHTPIAAVLLIVAGCLSPLLLGGLTSLLRELNPPDLPRAFALDAATYALAGIAGPAVAAVIAGLTGAAWAMIALSLSLILGAAVFTTLPIPTRPADRPKPRAASLLQGLTVMIHRPDLGAVTVSSGLSQLGLGALPLAAAAVAAQAHRPALTGVIVAVFAAGTLIGSILCTRTRIVQRHPERVMLTCTAAMTAPMLAAAFLPLYPALAMYALGGLLSAPIVIALFAVRDREAPPALRTQVFTLGAGLKVTAAAAGAAIGGLLVPHGPALLLTTLAICQAVAAVAGVLLLRLGRARVRQPGPLPVESRPRERGRPDAVSR